MDTSSPLPFYIKAPEIEHGRRLARRYVLQSAARIWLGMLIVLVCCLIPVLYAVFGINLAALPHWRWQWSAMVGLIYPLIGPSTIGIGVATRRLKELSAAGIALTPEML